MGAETTFHPTRTVKHSSEDVLERGRQEREQLKSMSKQQMKNYGHVKSRLFPPDPPEIQKPKDDIVSKK